MDYKKLLEKYMRDVLECEGTAFFCEGWNGEYGPHGYTKEEHVALLEILNSLRKEGL